MKYKWLNKKGNNQIILFFNGWGMDEGVVEHLEYNNFDVLMFYDYSSLDTDFDFEILNDYLERYLIAWSMGVMCATNFDIKYNKKIAINGTLKPIDNDFGIPEKIYNLTLNNFSPVSAKKFIANMFVGIIPDIEIKRDFENQKAELSALKKVNSRPNFVYDKILISSKDKIIPTKNQEKFWGISANLNSGHFPFNLFKNWGEIL